MISVRFIIIISAVHAVFAAAPADLIPIALSNNPRIAAAERAYTARAAEIVPAYFPANPSAGYEYMTTGENKFTVNQMFDFPLKTIFKANIRARDAAAAKYSVSLVKAETVRDIRIACAEIAAVKRLEELEKNKRAELALFRDIAESRYKVGRGEQAEYVRAKINMLLAEKRLLAFAAERETKMRMLAALLGTNDVPPTAFVLDLPKAVDAARIAAATNTFAGILMKNAALDKAGEESALAAAEALPDISLMGSFTASAMGNSASVFIGLTVPLYLPFKEVPRAAAASDMQESAKRELADTVNTIRADIAARTAAYAQSRETLALFSGSIIHEARQSLDASFRSYETGKITFQNLLENIIMLYDYYTEETAAQRDMIIAAAWLAFYTGEGVSP